MTTQLLTQKLKKMEAKFYKERISEKNAIELAAALVILIEKIDSLREDYKKMSMQTKGNSNVAHFRDGQANALDNLMNIINVLL